MLFGLKNAPANFQKAMDVILSLIKWQSPLIYLDDIFVISKTVTERLTQLKRVLTLLRDAGVTLKLKKSSFLAETISYLGHVSRSGRIEIRTATTDAFGQLKNPTTQTEIRSFLGLCNIFRRFVPYLSKVAAPLNKKLCKDQLKSFPSLAVEEKQAVECLKDLLSNPPTHALPRATAHYTVDTNACDIQIGCVLLQKPRGGRDRSIGNWSRTPDEPQKKLETTHKESLAVVWAVLLLRPYLEGNRFNIRTDHEAFK